MEHVYVKDLVEGQDVHSVYKIISGRIGTTSRGSKYIFLVVGDKTGDIVLKIWNATKEEEKLATEYVGMYLEIKGKVSSYQGNKELGDAYMELNSASDIESLGYTEDVFGNIAPVPLDNMKEYIIDTVNGIQDEKVSKVVKVVLNKYFDKFELFPAGRTMHHEYKHGLIYHTYTMLQSAKALVGVYGEEHIDTDVLYGGIVVHDIGKALEYNYDNEQTTMSNIGLLMGHISIAHGELYTIITKLGYDLENSDKLQSLLHVVLSHHGNLEWGSPVKPMTIEAHLVHHIDMIDSRMDIIKSKLMSLEEGEMSQRVFGLGNVPLFRH